MPPSISNPCEQVSLILLAEVRMHYKIHKIDYCEICGSNNKLTCHHIDPSVRGKERPEDITTLCECCHRELHRLVDSGWMDIQNAHFHMWMSSNREYCRTKQIRPLKRRNKNKYTIKYKGISKAFGITRKNVYKYLTSSGLATHYGYSQKAIDEEIYKVGMGWDLEKLREYWSVKLGT